MADTPTLPEDRIAPQGQVWTCVHCHKWAEDRYGMVGGHSPGWDESCALNAVLIPLEPSNG